MGSGLRGGVSLGFEAFAVRPPHLDEQWTETLRCPRCRKTAPASLTQSEHDETPRVNSLPVGFKVVYTQYGAQPSVVRIATLK